MNKYSHDEPVIKARHWLWKQGCSVVITEMACTREEPDAIGFWAGGHSIVVECKVSRGDFLADRQKRALRQFVGMGTHRYYLIPADLDIEPGEIPEPEEGEGADESVGQRSGIRRPKLPGRYEEADDGHPQEEGCGQKGRPLGAFSPDPVEGPPGPTAGAGIHGRDHRLCRRDWIRQNLRRGVVDFGATPEDSDPRDCPDVANDQRRGP